MTVPHRFPSLIEGPTQTIIIAGTGLSAPNAPVLEGLEINLKRIADTLGISVDNPGADDYFYDLAEAVLEQLVDNGKTDSESRLWLVEKLGMLDDRIWFGEIGLPLSGNTPRHRAIARFAVENRLRAIISLNWDALLETALDSVGLAEEPDAPPRPWQVTAYARIIEDMDLPCLGKPNVFPVIKPHGCVRNLEQVWQKFRSSGTITHVTFKLKKTELANLPPEQRKIIDLKVQCCVAECPLIAVGWKASEKYLRDIIIKTAKDVQHPSCDAFTLISSSWYPKTGSNGTYHDDIATAYGKNRLEAFVKVCKSGHPTHDDIFLWLQALYAMNRLTATSIDPQKTKLQQIIQQLEQPCFDHPILNWVDRWLPSWVRLCWRAGVMSGTNPHTGLRIESWDIPIIPRDVHVPLGCMSQERRDLQAAAKLLVILVDTPYRFKFDKYPGGLWCDEERCLYLPLPLWQGVAKPADLAALKPLVEDWHGLGFIQNIRLVCLDTEDVQPDRALCQQLEAQVRQLMRSVRFALGDAVSWASLENMKGDPHATVA
ncbi:MAG: hypothetical protein NTV58_05205 [Deltaproteobacteria bacterium]|nr:hypothetical protein [Deltaproteobacteria bacterium]